MIAYLRPENIVVLDDGEAGTARNVVDGEIERVIFEGPTAQLRVDVGGRELRADVGGGQRLTLVDRPRRVRLGFDDVTRDPGDDAAAAADRGRRRTRA